MHLMTILPALVWSPAEPWIPTADSPAPQTEGSIAPQQPQATGAWLGLRIGR